ncbi:DUF4350 domain-containing protein [Thiocapsa marina]|uniref:DUF4350 domain-containing protein n=1 Tax=Thiocapsa marina 5811 TaxID=768671 RepID=F9U8Q1_9GAMM|nr:DUF4350 domain-containing protein [Thiocapsa marina]EGV19159.1 hypothetical protein ThimaDRAFT_1303 [Thiocapsa marina 5811]
MTSERRVFKLVVVGLILIVVALIGAVLSQLERRTLQIEIGPSEEARRNPFLAAERFLARMEIPVASESGRERLRRLPPPTDTLVVRHTGSLAPERRRALDQWLTDGGRLVVTASAPETAGAEEGDLAAGYGVRPSTEDAKRSAADDHTEVIAEIPVEGTGRPLRAAFSTERALETVAEPDMAIIAADRLRLVRLPVGDGSLTVLAEDRFMTNAAIGEHDHALLMAYLLAPEPGGTVWLLYDREMPWLGAVVWSAAPYAVISGALCLLAWAWAAGARLGPLQPVPSRDRRDLLEHLDASGDFLWRHGQADPLIKPTRRRVLERWRRRRPDLGGLDDAGLAHAIALAADEDPDAVVRAFHVHAEDADAFVRQSALLQRLWRKASIR